MRAKTIAKTLDKKFSQWVKSIDDGDLRVKVHEDAIITGGCIASMLLGEEVNDYDIYFKTKETTLAVAKYYVDRWNDTHGAVKNKIGNDEYVYVLDGADVEAWKNGEKDLTKFCPNYREDPGWQDGFSPISHMISGCFPDQIKIIYPSDGYIEMDEMMEAVEDADELDSNNLLLEPEVEPEGTIEEKPKRKQKKPDTSKFHPIYMSSNAITLSDDIQITIRFYGTPQQIHGNYDFIHCCCYYDVDQCKLVTPEEALLAILAKELVYKGSKYPICSVIRTRKFINRGWRINAGQYLKMCFQISNLDLTNLDVLEDQLVGVDTVYFLNLIAKLRNDPNVELTNDYVASVIDKVFG